MGGIGLCLVAAGFLALVFRESSFGRSPFTSFLPFLFLAIIVFIAARFGSVPGILGTIGAAIVFAEFLFEPAFSLRVHDSAQRNSLIWMVIVGIAVSEILGVAPKTSNPSNGSRKNISGL